MKLSVDSRHDDTHDGQGWVPQLGQDSGARALPEGSGRTCWDREHLGPRDWCLGGLIPLSHPREPTISPPPSSFPSDAHPL